MHQGACRSGRTRRVVVTGIGAVTPVGIGVEGLWSGIISGRSAIRHITRFDASALTAQIAAEVTDFDPAEWLDTKSQRRLDRCSQFAVAATQMSLTDSGILMDDEDRSRIGVCIGSALGGPRSPRSSTNAISKEATMLSSRILRFRCLWEREHATRPSRSA